MDITYTKHGDYYYHDLTLPLRPTEDIGRFGRMRKKYLKEHQPDTFALMLMENTLTQHLIDIDRQTNEQIDLIYRATTVHIVHSLIGSLKSSTPRRSERLHFIIKQPLLSAGQERFFRCRIRLAVV